ncbi:MAG: hypothetical protein Q7T66_04755 [Herminiimonas sp.]|uniref:hypothetical protein n=1 Tax=Herminiimonas sp. TaxID=1926289 RepID=UPI00271837ED|nr:hypothetical protein [Herminiimonas sp.]MDO9419955.1 hypothetical protein [Herminiimonas sp.]
MTNNTGVNQQQLLQLLGFVSEADVAALSGVELSTLKKWRNTGTGPTYAYWGNEFFYPIDGLKTYLTSLVKERIPLDPASQML